MIITSVEATNFKGANFKHSLSPATAIIGPNMAGKTAIVQAVRLALAGYLPECGKTAKATWELSSGPEMTTGVQFDNEDKLTRRFWLDGSIVKSAEHRCGPGDLDDFANLPLLNAEAYFGLTDSERTAYVFERIKLPDTYTKEAIVSECERISFEEAHTEQIEKAKGVVISGVKLAWDDQIGMTVQDALSASIEAMRQSFSFWNKRAKDTQGAVTTLAELKLRETSVVAAAQGGDQQIIEGQKALDKLLATKGRLEAQQEEAERTATRIDLLKRQVDAVRTDYVQMNKKLSANIKSAKSRRSKLELNKQARVNLVAGMASVSENRRAAHRIEVEAERTIEATNQKVEELSDHECCPFCKSTGKEWKANLSGEYNQILLKAEPARAEAAAIRERHDKSLTEMKSSLEASDAAAATNAQLLRSIETWEAEIKANEKAKASDDARLAEMKEELKTLEQRPKAEDLTEQIDQNHHARCDASEVINAARVRLDAETRLKQELKLAAQAEIEHQEAKAHVLVIKKIAGVLKDRREAMITEAFGGLLKVANTVVEGIFNQPLALHENTIGMWRKAKFIPHRVFSGTEKALTYIAVAVALSAQAPLKLVILDEFGRLDEANQVRVLRRLRECVTQKVINQFIVVGTSLPDEAIVDNLQVIGMKV